LLIECKCKIQKRENTLLWSRKEKKYNNEVCDRRYRTLPVDGKDALLGRQELRRQTTQIFDRGLLAPKICDEVRKGYSSPLSTHPIHRSLDSIVN
jgi:hypothetical protein